ncbi:MAG: response regulator transcription factor [Bacteroidales bacterium]
MNQKQKFHLLLVEDDPNLSFVIRDYLEMLEYDITHSTDGEDGLKTFLKGAFDLVILDVMLPKKDGFTVAEEIRKINHSVPIIFLTARSLNEDRIRGFKSGCDDYITKPFNTEELSLRIKAILKRCIPVNQTEFTEEMIFKLGNFTFDAANMMLRGDGTELTLTKKESALLHLLCQYRNKLLPREVALEKIWGDSDYFIGRSMDVFISKLRKYLKSDPRIAITNVHGTGFKLEVKEK